MTTEELLQMAIEIITDNQVVVWNFDDNPSARISCQACGATWPGSRNTDPKWGTHKDFCSVLKFCLEVEKMYPGKYDLELWVLHDLGS